MTKHITSISGLLLVCLIILPSQIEAVASGLTGDHLSSAISLYKNGDYDKSFAELTAHVGENRYCAVAYYYRARIRVIKGDYRRASLSLKAAFRDSTGYADAHALHAYILKETGHPDEALMEWARFLSIIGDVSETTEITSIVLPETYYTLKVRERERKFQDAAIQTASVPATGQTLEVTPAEQDNSISELAVHNNSHTFQLSIIAFLTGAFLYSLYHFLYFIPKKRREMFIDEYIAYPDADKFADEVFIFKPEEKKIYITHSDGKQKAKSIYNYIA